LAEEISNSLPERLARRIHVALPVRVTYWDSAIKPCLEMACTYDISEKGARVTGLRNVKTAGEIIAVERGRNKQFCRVVWIGEPNSELDGQIGIQCVESDRTMWDAELRDMHEVYDLIVRESSVRRSNFSAGSAQNNRRRHERFDIEGLAELLKDGPNSTCGEAVLRNLSELGCLITTKQDLPLGTELKLVLNVDSYDLSVKGQVRHSDHQLGLGVEFQEIRKGDRQILRFLLRKLAEQQLEENFELELQG
jgi:PilZ domain